MNPVFTVTTGRTGSDFLSATINRYGIGCLAEHEPPALLLRRLGERQFFRRRGWLEPAGRLASLGRNFQRRYLFTDEQLGRGQVFDWIETGKTDELQRATVEWRLRRLAKFRRRGIRHYIECSQFFIRGYARPLLRALPGAGLIRLTRDPLSMARSYANRGKDPFLNMPQPHRRQNRLRLDDWRDLDAFRIYCWIWLETERRYEDLLLAFPDIRRFEIDTTQLSDPEILSQLFACFGIEHQPLVDLAPTNTNIGRRLPATETGPADKQAFFDLLDRLPPALLADLGALRRYGLMPSGVERHATAR